ncbi:hypothetical protein [Bradyrhizobium nitroreducens]|uniref:hypothetical protein n=1 Tax=Bradyrhizobium nitroreducens TaxID=709803 RepID=UPI0011AEB8BE|nr:hypothetical protein [Bradyrhizobium nitroreducens]
MARIARAIFVLGAVSERTSKSAGRQSAGSCSIGKKKALRKPDIFGLGGAWRKAGHVSCKPRKLERRPASSMIRKGVQRISARSGSNNNLQRDGVSS